MLAEALDCAKHAAKLASSSKDTDRRDLEARARYHCGVILHGMGKNNQARGELRRAATAGNAEAKRALNAIGRLTGATDRDRPKIQWLLLAFVWLLIPAAIAEAIVKANGLERLSWTPLIYIVGVLIVFLLAIVSLPRLLGLEFAGTVKLKLGADPAHVDESGSSDTAVGVTLTFRRRTIELVMPMMAGASQYQPADLPSERVGDP